MNATDLSQVVLPPGPRDEALEAALSARLRAQTPRLPVRRLLTLFLARWLHPLMHVYVAWKTYDPASDRIIDTGGKVCMYCTKGYRSR